ncbi:uncharacterized protein LOC141703043 [Apium graveolens]|uniref:uncharacterized protein LOC141703043 n=1 Tax=Apium graveolens TaxID=4045 RepID=UPI003D794C87
MAGRCYGQALVMAEMEPENRKTIMSLPKGQSRKKHREHLSKRPRLDVNMIEDFGYSVTNADARIQKFVESKEKTKVEPAQQTIEVDLEPGNPTRKIKIGKGLETTFQKELIGLLKEHADVFAWSPEDMPGIDESVAMHSLDVDPKQKPIKQKRRNFAPERQQAIDQEVEKLLKADIICEIKYPDWLANVVLVKKPNDKWRMCVDYTNLNSACPKDSYPLPNIDQLIDATSGHVMLSFMDAFSGYNQVKMNLADIAKTAFITHRAVYAFVMMPFGLINAGATYQKMMNTIFKEQLGRNMESYVDDMIAKSVTTSELIREENGTQTPVYYASQVLKDAETRYPNLEKFTLALVHSSRKLRQYFQGREIRVITNQPLRKIIHKPDASGRLVNWAIKLSQFNIKFIPRTTIKAQALAEFVMECTFPETPETPETSSKGKKESNNRDLWTLYVDGSATAERCGAGLILSSPDGFVIQQAITFAFKATNNQAEYEALLSGLRLAKSLGVRRLTIYSDSQIVVR